MDFEQLLAFIIVILSLFIVMLVYLFVWYEKFGKKKLQTFKDAAAALLKAQMLNIYNECNKKGYTTTADLQSFESCYKPYHDMGLNDVGDKLHESMKALPMKTEEGES
ncbi:MAG: hypothetical protein HUJ78_02870 [Mogibacterium sp.]|nr:hypothetical protein [Mogibacterium sp.]